MTNLVNGIALFDELSEVERSLIYNSAFRKKYTEGENIIWQGDACEGVYFVLSGVVEIYRLSPGGREQILDRIPKGGCFNLVPALRGTGLNPANARVLSVCELLVIPNLDFLQLIKEIPIFGFAVARFFADRLASMTDLIESLSLFSVRQRLAMFLIHQADTPNDQGSVRWTQTEIASRLGTVRDVLGRCLRKFEEEGAVRIEKGVISLLDRQKLERAISDAE